MFDTQPERAISEDSLLSAPSRFRVLLLTQATGFSHSSIPITAASIHRLGFQTGLWEVAGEAGTAQEVRWWTSPDNLKGIDLVFFANTSGDIGMTDEGAAAFFGWLREGGAFAGVHSAASTLQENVDYIELVGASTVDQGHVRTSLFDHGPERQVTIHVQDPTHPACTGLPPSFRVYDEILDFSGALREHAHVLLSISRHPSDGHAGDFPIAWTKRFGKGRMFYTSLGHSAEMYSNRYFLSHLVGGMRWALGATPGDDTVGNPVCSDTQDTW
jgi:type 1 glutamine amidotransferase